MSREEMMQKLKAEIDQSFDEDDMWTLNILWTIEGIDGTFPIHEAMEIAYEVQEQYGAVKRGEIPHW